MQPNLQIQISIGSYVLLPFIDVSSHIVFILPLIKYEENLNNYVIYKLGFNHNKKDRMAVLILSILAPKKAKEHCLSFGGVITWPLYCTTRYVIIM